MATYIAMIRKEDQSAFGVDFPDFPGCISAGATLDEALRNARDALLLHVKGMLEDGEVIPIPSTLDAIRKDKHNRDAVPSLVTVPEARSHAVEDVHAKLAGESRRGKAASRSSEPNESRRRRGPRPR